MKLGIWEIEFEFSFTYPEQQKCSGTGLSWLFIYQRLILLALQENSLPPLTYFLVKRLCVVGSVLQLIIENNHWYHFFLSSPSQPKYEVKMYQKQIHQLKKLAKRLVRSEHKSHLRLPLDTLEKNATDALILNGYGY